MAFHLLGVLESTAYDRSLHDENKKVTAGVENRTTLPLSLSKDYVLSAVSVEILRTVAIAGVSKLLRRGDPSKGIPKIPYS